MQRISADLIHTNVGPPLENHCVVVDDKGSIRDVLPVEDLTVDRHLTGSVVPGFVNAHCHLELSHTKGLITPGNGLVNFALELFAKRKADPDVVQQAIKDADTAMFNNGIVAVGDIANGVTTVERKQNSKVHYHTFAEALGFREADAERSFATAENVYNAHRKAGLSASIAPHAPYSMSRGLMKLLSNWYKKHDAVASMHYFESVAEIEFCIYGTGDVNRILEYLDYPLDEVLPYGEDGPSGALRFLNDAKLLLLVHNTFANDTDLGIAHALFDDKLWLCTCPKANLYIEDERPDYLNWMQHTLNVCIGTDSLASNDALSVWDEMKAVHSAEPTIPFEELLRWATLNGAKALQIDERFGSIDIGKHPGLVWLEHGGHQGVWGAVPKRVDVSK